MKSFLIFIINFISICYSQDGYIEYFYPNDNISSNGILNKGKPDGIWKSYFVDGKLKSCGRWKNNLLDSIWMFYYPNGLIERKINYLDGKKNGYEYYYNYLKIKDTVISILKSEELYLNNSKEGFSKYYYDNGNIHFIKKFLNNKEESEAFEYDSVGKLISILIYRNGILIENEFINRYNSYNYKIGIWKSFYQNGKLKSEESYLNDTLNGFCKYYNEFGDILEYKRYIMGKIVNNAISDSITVKLKVKYYNKVNENGDSIKEFSGSFIHNKPIGVHRYYDIYGNINSSKLYDLNGNLIGEGIVDEEGNKIGKWKFYYVSGKLKSEGNYSDNKKFGNWKFYFENGNLEQIGNFKKDKLDGLWKWYDQNKILLRDEMYDNGVQNGSFVEYDSDGNIVTQGDYLDGLKEGLWIDKSGNHQEIGTYKAGLKDGEWLYKYHNGIIYYKGNFLMGVVDGKHQYFHENGKLKLEQYYNNGLKVNTWYIFDYYGDLIKTYTFQNDLLIKIDGINITE